MSVLELLAPLQSYAVSKVRKLSQLLWRFSKHAIKHPIKTIFLFVKLWLCLMVFSLFATLAMANPLPPQYDPTPVSPDSQTTSSFACVVNNGTYQVSTLSGQTPIDESPHSSCLAPAINYLTEQISSSSNFCSITASYTLETSRTAIVEYKKKVWGNCSDQIGSVRTTYGAAAVGVPIVTESCPPESAPHYNFGFTTNDTLMCYKLDPDYDDGSDYENSCPEPTADDTYVFGTAVSPSNVCYDNPEEQNSQCNISTDDTGGYYLPSKYGSQEPVECKAPSNGGDPTDTDPEDLFCYVYGTSGVYTADCPTTSISFNISGIEKNADQLIANHQRFQDIENSMISQTQIDELLESGELKGEKGDKGDRGERGLMGTQGLQGIQGVAGAAGADGSDGVDGIDGQNGEDGKDGKDGINGVDGADGLDGADGRDGSDGRDGTNGVDGQDGQDGEDGEDGEDCSVVNTNNGAVISCPDGSSSEVEGIDTDAVVSELVKQTNEIKKQTEEISKIGTYDGDAPKIDYTTRPEKYNEIANFDWENNNFGTVLEEHNDAMRNLPLFAAIDDFFVTSFGGNCPVWSETVTVLDASFNITFDQFCSSAVQSILPAIRAILMLIAGFFAWRIAIE